MSSFFPMHRSVGPKHVTLCCLRVIVKKSSSYRTLYWKINKINVWLLLKGASLLINIKRNHVKYLQMQNLILGKKWHYRYIYYICMCMFCPYARLHVVAVFQCVPYQSSSLRPRLPQPGHHHGQTCIQRYKLNLQELCNFYTIPFCICYITVVNPLRFLASIVPASFRKFAISRGAQIPMP